MSKKKKRKKSLPPQRKRMQRPARLQVARTWIPTYSGKDLVVGYANWFGLDRLAAAIELLSLGAVPADRVQHERKVVSDKTAARAKERERRQRAEDLRNDWYDGEFAYIAGYAFGHPYGTTWDDLEEAEFLAWVEDEVAHSGWSDLSWQEQEDLQLLAWEIEQTGPHLPLWMAWELEQSGALQAEHAALDEACTVLAEPTAPDWTSTPTDHEAANLVSAE